MAPAAASGTSGRSFCILKKWYRLDSTYGCCRAEFRGETELWGWSGQKYFRGIWEPPWPQGTWNMNQYFRGHCSQGDGQDSEGKEPCVRSLAWQSRGSVLRWWQVRIKRGNETQGRDQPLSFFAICLRWKWKSLSRVRLFDPMDYQSEILQARILEWVAFPFSRGSSQPRDWTQVSCIAGGFFTSWATGEAPA